MHPLFGFCSRRSCRRSRIRMSRGGADLKIIATLANRLGYDVVAAPNIKTAKNLRSTRSRRLKGCATFNRG